ncbi:protein of unknown function [Reichenbachiella faecimaris]|uniref:Pesticidal crystal protein Cry22Aa Ig-like domain-containing protein n=1 Tax=Reichenbachiella faecimaris TaxID=692418 RepID=A0A1W2GK95_REIFA|nr:immunoglobulin-like domain-containing protein [Reichenbachiella faecimaris]SMD36902.1 protein of unknown function [Reichenbachiella faecimaris]
MKNLKYILLAILPVVLLSSCAEDMPTGELITYPTIVFTGENTVTLAPGETYVEPGVDAFQGDAVLPLETSVTSRYRGYSGSEVGSDPDVYYVNYTATNADGFVGTAARTVIVPPIAGDMVTDLSGMYTATTTRIGGESYSGMQVMIWPEGGNTFGISCNIGHFYADGRAFGTADNLYLGAGSTITVNAPGDYTFTSGFFAGFGINFTITSMTVNAATKTITWSGEGNFANSVWDVVAVQQ